MNKLALAGVALAFVGAGCAQTQTKVEAPMPTPTNPPSATAPAAQVPEAMFKNMIEVKDQKSGDEAMMDTVFLEKKGYIVIHEDDNGSIGTIVGHSDLLNHGETKSVILKMNLHPGLSHSAMLHVDNGDGVFDEKQDLPLKDENGVFIMKSFKGMGEAMKKGSGM